MDQKIKWYIMVLFCFAFHNAISGNNLNLSITIPDNLDSKKIKILIDDGLEQKFITATFINRRCVIKYNVHVLYATITILYPNKNEELYGIRLLVNAAKPSSVFFKKVYHDIANLLSNYKLKNVIVESKCKEYIDLQRFCKLEMDSNSYYSKQYSFSKNDSNLNIYNQSSVRLALKQMEFIKKHGNKYYFFWFFRLNVANVLLKTHQLELYEIFNTSFPKEFKDSYEGENLKALIEGNIFIKKGSKSPLFDIADYRGNRVSSEMYKGKYILLNFWATWCAPCIAEIPLLKKIRNSYTIDKLEMISISYDKDSTVFLNGIKKYQLNWTNVYSNTNLQNLFGKKPIPSVYLIDPNGILIFSSWEDSLEQLQQILKNIIK